MRDLWGLVRRAPPHGDAKLAGLTEEKDEADRWARSWLRYNRHERVFVVKLTGYEVRE